MLNLGETNETFKNLDISTGSLSLNELPESNLETRGWLYHLGVHPVVRLVWT